MQEWQHMLVRPNASLIDAIRIIDSGGGQIAIVTGEDGRLLGVVTDADVRKAIIRGIDFNQPCSTVMTTTPIVLNVASSRTLQLDVMRQRHVRQLPLVDDAGRLVDVALFMNLVGSEGLPNRAVIMAGGLGSRLGHLTSDAPKPLLPVGDRPLLETILLQLVRQGFYHFFFSVNYKAEMIMDHFGDGSRWGVEIEYLRERERLGTAGALHLLPDGIKDDFLVMNGDLLTKIDLRAMLAVHKMNAAAMTMAVKEYAMRVPYGVVQIDGDSRITALEEKPMQNFFVNAGIYIINPDALKYIPDNTFFDMPSLFGALKNRQAATLAFPIREFWMDIGVPKDYERAHTEYAVHFDE